jgi:hypothetical protein
MSRFPYGDKTDSKAFTANIAAQIGLALPALVKVVFSTITILKRLE